jgi:hypothetical protein
LRAKFIPAVGPAQSRLAGNFVSSRAAKKSLLEAAVSLMHAVAAIAAREASCANHGLRPFLQLSDLQRWSS